MLWAVWARSLDYAPKILRSFEAIVADSQAFFCHKVPNFFLPNHYWPLTSLLPPLKLLQMIFFIFFILQITHDRSALENAIVFLK